ncbi:MAG: type II secretion system protein GspJ [Desulfuromonadales bacterium]
MKWSISRLSFSRSKCSEQGFTLVEVLVAISILAILMTSIYGIFSSVSVARERLDADSAEYHRARVIFDRMGRELRGTYFQARNNNLHFAGGETDFLLELTTTAVSPLSRMGTGLARIRYLLVTDPEEAANGQVLMRSERPVYDAKPGEEADEMMRLAPGIETMTLRFFANGQWQEQWDARSSGLPEMVEIALQLRRDGQESAHFLSAFEIPKVEAK